MNRLPTLILAAAFAPGLCAAGAAKPDVSVEFGAGYQFDSNVALVELDDISGSADFATQLRAAVGATLPMTRHARLTLGYDVDSTTYAEQDEFDLVLQHATAGFGVTLAGTELGIAADRYDADLAGEGYLSLTQVSPSIARLFGSSLYARLAYSSASKRFDSDDARNADTQTWRTDLYWLLNGMDRYVSMSAQRMDENALDDALDFDGRAATLAYGQVLENRAVTVKLKTELRYESRDYAMLADSGEAPRQDRRLRAGILLTMPIGKHVELGAELARIANTSTLESAEFDRTIAGLNFDVTF